MKFIEMKLLVLESTVNVNVHKCDITDMEKLAVKLTLQAIATFFTGVKYEKSEMNIHM